MPEENEYKPNTSIYNGTPVGSPEQEAEKRAERLARQAMLPKLKLDKGEEFCIDRETIKNLNKDYFTMLNDMHRGFNIAPEELRSYMNSVVVESYKSDIAKLQREGLEKAKTQETIQKYKSRALEPGYEKDHWWQRRSHPNEALEQLIKLGNIEAAIEFAARAAEIERQKEFIEDNEPSAEENFFYLIADEFIPARKRKRFINKQYERLMRFITEYAQENASDKLYKLLLNELAAEKKREKFEEQNGEYLRVLVNDFIKEYNTVCEEPDEAAEPEPSADSDETAETTEAIATEEETGDEGFDEAAELERLRELEEDYEADGLDDPEPADEEPPLEETTPGEPVQEEMKLRLVPVPYSSFGVLVQQTVAGQAGETAEPAEEPVAHGNANGENEEH